MTNDQMQTVKEDIAYLRAMAAEGRRTPLLGAAILIWAGLIFSTASIVAWASASGALPITQDQTSFVWLGAMVLFAIVLTIACRRMNGKPGAMSPVNRAAGTAWMGVGIAIFVLSLSMAAAVWRFQSGEVLAIFPSLIFALYGSGWAVSAAMSDKKWLWWVAIGAWVGAPVLALLTGDPAQYLAYAVGLLLLTVAPGVVLIRQEPAEVI